MEVGVALEGIDEALRVFEPAKAERAIQYSIDDTARQTVPAAKDSIRKEQKYNIKARDLNRKLKAVKLARAGDLEAVLEGRGRPIALTYFGAKQTRHLKAGGSRVQTAKSGRRTKGRARSAAGVEVQVIKGHRTVLKRAFIASVKTKKAGVHHTGVFQRVGKGRLPIEARAMVTIASLFGNQKTIKAAHRKIDEVWPRRFKHHIERIK